MQINFEAEQIRAAHAYVDRLTPEKVEKKEKILEKDEVVIDKKFYTTKKEEKPSFFKNILNFLFK